jgi:hypothetical protein
MVISALILAMIMYAMHRTEFFALAMSRNVASTGRDLIFLKIKRLSRSQSILYQSVGYLNRTSNKVAPIASMPANDADGNALDFAALYQGQPFIPTATLAAYPNYQLILCMFNDEIGVPPNDCIPGNGPFPLSLVDLDGKTLLTSPPGAPTATYFDYHGEPCSATDPAGCPFLVTTQFTPYCGGGAASCSIAEWITVHTTVRPNPLATQLTSGLQALAARTQDYQVNISDAAGASIPVVPAVWPWCSYLTSAERGPACTNGIGSIGVGGNVSGCPVGYTATSSGCASSSL